MYKLTEGDLQIIRRAQETNNPNWFLNFYLRSPGSGTWWRPVSDDDLDRLVFHEFRVRAQEMQAGYGRLADIWHQLGKPDYFGHADSVWRALTPDEYESRIGQMEPYNYHTVYPIDGGEPSFHNNHGLILIPWQLQMHQVPQEEVVVVGGLGSAKTLGALARMIYHSATLRGYRGIAMAPNSYQAEEFHSLAREIIADTLFEDRFLEKAPMRPRPTLIISNDLVRRSRIECIPVAKEPDKARTVTGDECVIDQCEKFEPDVLAELRRSMGTRFRGQLHGRQKVGRTAYLANSGDNDALWAMFDEAKKYSRDVWAFSPPSVLNIYLTVKDLIRFQNRVGRDEDSQRMYLRGERPMGSGEHFNAMMLKLMRDNDYTAMLKRASEEPVYDMLEEERDPQPGYIWREAPETGCHYFKTPAESGHQYVIVADPGTKNPPHRDSPVVAVWDITNFPHAPAVLVAFSWVFAHGDIEAWMAQYMEWAIEYRCAGGSAGYDATGQQSTYEKMPFGLQEIDAVGYNFGGNAKYGWLGLLKLFMRRGLLRTPYLTGMFGQLVRYKLPDEKIAQDIVMMLVVLAAMLETLWYSVFGADGELIEDDPEEMRPEPYDRYDRPAEARYPGHERSM